MNGENERHKEKRREGEKRTEQVGRGAEREMIRTVLYHLYIKHHLIYFFNSNECIGGKKKHTENRIKKAL